MKTMTKERPILFSAPMVRALLDGRETQTRRVVKPQYACQRVTWGCRGGQGFGFFFSGHEGDDDGVNGFIKCPYGQPGDRLWVRETWAVKQLGSKPMPPVQYRADYKGPYSEIRPFGNPDYKWRPSIHMPRWASRITLEIVSVRVERVKDISEEDAKAEGVERFTKDGKLMKFWAGDPSENKDVPPCTWQDMPRSAREAYAALWDSINGAGSWASNPWCWVLEFRRVTP